MSLPFFKGLYKTMQLLNSDCFRKKTLLQMLPIQMWTITKCVYQKQISWGCLGFLVLIFTSARKKFNAFYDYKVDVSSFENSWVLLADFWPAKEVPIRRDV